MELLRTRTDGCYRLQSNYWGTYLSPADDPLADTVITKEQFEGFELSDQVSRLPASLWNRWINLCIEVLRRGNRDLEVSCRLLRNIEDPTQYRIAVPQQEVTGVSVRVDSFDKAIDIETGEVITQWPPEGWRPCGSSHSHNTMAAFFSGTDDRYELGDPGLHIVVGTINEKTGEYTLEASVTANMRRFIIDPDDVVELNTDVETTYHPDVLTAIKIPTAVATPRRMTTAGWDYGYESDFYPQWSTKSTKVSASGFVAEERKAVMDAVDQLVKACNAKQLDVASILHEVAFDIDDVALIGEESVDPFYWSV